MELSEVFSTIFDRLPGLRLDIPLKQVGFKKEAVFYGLRSLPVSWDDAAARAHRGQQQGAKQQGKGDH
jgi:hypothetical protein